jgi:hypothetical protein
MATLVKILNFEPLVHRLLVLLLAHEADLQVVSDDAGEVDVLLFRPVSAQSVLALRSQFPLAHFVALIEWHQRFHFESSPIDVCLDALSAYECIAASLRR